MVSISIQSSGNNLNASSEQRPRHRTRSAPGTAGAKPAPGETRTVAPSHLPCAPAQREQALQHGTDRMNSSLVGARPQAFALQEIYKCLPLWQ